MLRLYRRANNIYSNHIRIVTNHKLSDERYHFSFYIKIHKQDKLYWDREEIYETILFIIIIISLV